MQELTIKASIPELIAKRGMALDKIERAINDLKDALALANDSCIGGKQNASSSLVDAIRDQIRFGRVEYDAEKIRVALDRSMWRSFVVNTPLWSLMDTKARKQFDQDMAGIPPEATEENLRATMSLYFEDAGKIGFVHPDRFPETGELLHEGDIAYHIRKGLHYLSREDWSYFIKYLNR